MRIIDLVQGSKTWLAWRQQGISATDSPVILDKSPYKTPWRLWGEKTGKLEAPDISGNPNVIRGNRLEPVARKYYEEKYGEMLIPFCAEWDQNPVLRASYDGVSADGIPVEFKAPADSTYTDILERGVNSTAFELYSLQVQQQILVADAEKGYLFFFHETKEPIRFEIQRDDQIIAEIIEKGEAFWLMVNAKGEPEKNPERDIFTPTDDQEKQWTTAARAYRTAERHAKELEVQVKELKAEMKQAEKQLVDLMGNFRTANYSGVSVTQFLRAGTIDYKKFLHEKLPEVDELELETYRRKASKSVRVSGDQHFTDDDLKDIKTGTGPSWF